MAQIKSHGKSHTIKIKDVHYLEGFVIQKGNIVHASLWVGGAPIWKTRSEDGLTIGTKFCPVIGPGLFVLPIVFHTVELKLSSNEEENIELTLITREASEREIQLFQKMDDLNKNFQVY